MCLPRGTYLVVPMFADAGMAPTTPDFRLPLIMKPGGQHTDVNFGCKPE